MEQRPLLPARLLHEMIHQYHMELTGRTEETYGGHGPAFRDECNRIGAVLGLPKVRAGKERGRDKALPSCASWPLNVRPDGYYLGAYPPEPAAPKEPAEEGSDGQDGAAEGILGMLTPEEWTVMMHPVQRRGGEAWTHGRRLLAAAGQFDVIRALETTDTERLAA